MSIRSKAKTKIDDIKENYRERRIASKVRDAAGAVKDEVDKAADRVRGKVRRKTSANR